MGFWFCLSAFGFIRALSRIAIIIVSVSFQFPNLYPLSYFVFGSLFFLSFESPIHKLPIPICYSVLHHSLLVHFRVFIHLYQAFFSCIFYSFIFTVLSVYFSALLSRLTHSAVLRTPLSYSFTGTHSLYTSAHGCSSWYIFVTLQSMFWGNDFICSTTALHLIIGNQGIYGFHHISNTEY